MTQSRAAESPLDRAVLKKISVFAGLDDHALDYALQAARKRRVAQGDTVFHQGDEATSFFVLIDGRLKVTQTTPEGLQVIIRYIGPREMFGCVAVCGGLTYPGTATAVEGTTIVGWGKATTQDMMERFPRLAMNALGTLGSRIQESHARLRELSTERVERRIAHALVRLVTQAGRKVPEGVEIDFPMTRQDLAEMTGTTLHTVSRTLSTWEANGIVENRRQKVIIRDPHALVSIAEDLPDER